MFTYYFRKNKPYLFVDLENSISVFFYIPANIRFLHSNNYLVMYLFVPFVFTPYLYSIIFYYSFSLIIFYSTFVPRIFYSNSDSKNMKTTNIMIFYYSFSLHMYLIQLLYLWFFYCDSVSKNMKTKLKQLARANFHPISIRFHP